MLKKLTILLALVAGFAIADTPDANAWGYRRVAPVRRVLAPPYPVARAAVGPRYYARPYYSGYRGYGGYGPGYGGYGTGYGGYGTGLGGGIYIGF